jgi:hypothetical protein
MILDLVSLEVGSGVAVVDQAVPLEALDYPRSWESPPQPRPQKCATCDALSRSRAAPG